MLRFLYSKDFVEVDENYSKTRYLADIYYESNGNPLQTFNYDYELPQWDYIVPGSIMETIVEAARNINAGN